ncbi:hypothetical protein INR49_032227 [Caranx melampygus]|nr:hypothetical protein INR49_032227 [Caranx melampygus]
MRFTADEQKIYHCDSETFYVHHLLHHPPPTGSLEPQVRRWCHELKTSLNHSDRGGWCAVALQLRGLSDLLSYITLLPKACDHVIASTEARRSERTCDPCEQRQWWRQERLGRLGQNKNRGTANPHISLQPITCLLHVNMDCGIFTSKTILLFLSLIFWAAGAALAYVGAFVIKSYDSFDSFIQDKYTLVPAAIIIGISLVMFLFGLLGCCATIRESKFGLTFFFLIIMAIFAAEVAALAFCFIYQGNISGGFEKTMNEIFAKYDGQSPETKSIDSLQQQMQCCGIKNYTSWNTTAWFSSHNNTVPLSCCKNSTSQCTGRLDQPDLLNTEGCEPKMTRLLQDVLGYAMLVVLGFAIIKVRAGAVKYVPAHTSELHHCTAHATFY